MSEANKLPKENKMGYMPVNKLLINMSLPMIISMIIQALYNIVDSMYVSQIGESAFTAVTLAFPVQSLMIAVGGGTGVGINALLSRSLGEKNFDEANRAANNGMLLGLINGLVFLVIGLTLPKLFFSMQTGDAEIRAYGEQYMSIVSLFSVGLFGQFTFERLLQATGKTVYSMISQIVGAVANIILDPIFIFGYLGLPAMGVAGAAIATVIGQFLGMLTGLYFNLAKNPEIKLSLSLMRPKASTIKRIYAVGVPSMIMQSIGSVMFFFFNRILLMFSTTATAVFGVYFNLQSFVFMPVFGLTGGLVPIISYNYGARRKDRMLQALKLATIYGMGIMAIGFAIFQIAPHLLLGIFNASDAMFSMGMSALRIMSIGFLFAGFSIVNSTVFQALGKGTYSLYISITRQLVVLLPTAYLLAQLGDVNLVWLSFPIAEIASTFVTFLFMRHTKKNIINTIEPLDGDKEITEPYEQELDEVYGQLETEEAESSISMDNNLETGK